MTFKTYAAHFMPFHVIWWHSRQQGDSPTSVTPCIFIVVVHAWRFEVPFWAWRRPHNNLRVPTTSVQFVLAAIPAACVHSVQVPLQLIHKLA